MTLGVLQGLPGWMYTDLAYTYCDPIRLGVSPPGVMEAIWPSWSKMKGRDATKGGGCHSVQPYGVRGRGGLPRLPVEREAGAIRCGT